MNAEDQVGHIFTRIKQWVKTHRAQSIAILGGVLIAGAGIAAYAILSQPAPEVEQVKPAPPKPKPVVKYYSPLNGIEVAAESDTKKTVTAVLIENSPDARPQSGIRQAEVVYEAIAEGGITRFLALYQQNTPGTVGPVRSLRMYFLDWAAPYQASIVHVGGSLYSLQEIRNGQYRDVDIENHRGYSWRATDRYAPHNVYTSFEKLGPLNAELGFTQSEFTSFSRTDGKASEQPNATSIDIKMSSTQYNSHYSYDAATNTYARNQGNGPHTDREDGQVSPSVVVALKVDMTTVMEDGYRQNIGTTGSGTAYVFQNGTVQEVTWQKSDRFSPLKLTDANGADINLVRGQTWVAAVPNGSGAVSWQ